MEDAPKVDVNCKCCNGSGVQQKLDGIKVYCPACQGTGESPFVNKNIKLKYVPPYIIKEEYYGKFYC